MKFYTIYLSTNEALFSEIKSAIYKIDEYISVQHSSFIDLTLKSQLTNFCVDYDLPQDKDSLYVCITDNNDNRIQTELENIHKSLEMTFEYFVVRYKHSSQLYTQQQINSIAEQLVRKLTKLNDGIWLGGKLHVE